MPARFGDAALLYNPAAGRGRARRERELDRAAHLLDAYGIRVTRFATAAPGSATALAREQVAAGRDLLIVCGGDGTLNEAVNGMVGSSVPLALLPAGTGNVLAKELGLPWDIWRAAEYIPRGEVRRIALGKAVRPGAGQTGERYFLSVAGAGADGQMVYSLNLTSKLRLGILAFWLEGFRQLFRYDFPAFDVVVGDERLPAAQVVIARTKEYGGPIRITRRADLFGNDFEVCVFPPRFRLFYLLCFLAQMVEALERFPSVRFLRARALRVEGGAGRVHAQVDGEPAGALPLEFSVVPDALSLLVPQRRLG